MEAEIINVGTELLMGNVVNTNGAYLARECSKLGIGVYYHTVIGDNEKRVKQAVMTARERASLIFLTGGLGPTQDDMTKEAVAGVFQRKLVEDPKVKEEISQLFERMGKKKIPENNWKQAKVLEGAIILHNENGTAPGFILEEGKTTVILLPGPPRELYPMFENKVIPYLSARQDSVLYTKMVKICGVGESKVEEQIKDLIREQSNPAIATYAKTSEVHIRVTAKGKDETEAKKLVKPVVKELKKRFGNGIYTTDETVNLEESVVNLLRKHELTMVTAESCTGGMIASMIVNVPGASSVLKESFVTYSNRAKRKYLDVSKSTLKKYTEYSEKCAKEMARGAALVNDCDVSVAVTGIAGPDGGTEEKPVGLVYVSCYAKGKVIVEEHHFQGTRLMIREQSATCALDLLRRCIMEQYE
ncbi:competence/damage-inducible protein A [[Clostridium] polysaccharolyticum]|uniref:Putative competence-damage inducible protein n=1 Tax=[Clostridium] polysaccharolyticum TaxID=29364 RepID=A0A1I0AFW3_9FIRM|nr:competence/damage-inducible protein A [[Clostridium] polysaccharolyticum]SES92139.1 competence/damage-inducible protein cinA [[Clostridium] polysaccharolyticum]